MKTTLHHYQFDSAMHPGYKAMVAQIKANGNGRGQWMHCFPSDTTRDTRDLPANRPELVELDPTFLFGNQWNEADPGNGKPGRRLFDWYEAYTDTKVKYGHWLEITPEMAEARRTTHACGYCGKLYGPYHEGVRGEFCHACLDSEYLKSDDLYLLRLLPVVEPGSRDRKPLTDAERAVLMPDYVRRQTTGNDSRAKQKRDRQCQSVLNEYAKTTAHATTERDGMLWLWDHGVSLDNVIYYTSSGKFCFGWRSPLSPEVKSALLDLISEFPYEYEIK